MLDLTNQEKKVLLFLSLTFFVGLGINIYKKTYPDTAISIRQTDLRAAEEDADQIIAERKTVNINSSDIDELTRLSGIGQALAMRIIEYRRSHGPFADAQELMRVKGIGTKKYQQIKDLITVE